MLSLESRKDPVHQAALAFFLLAGLVVAGALVTHGAIPIVYPTLVSLIGVFVWRRSLVALTIGTAFCGLLFVLGSIGAIAKGMHLSTLVVVFIFQGSIFFVMARGLVAKWRTR